MEDALVAALLKQLQPAFYVVGAVTVICLFVYGGAILKLIWELKKNRDQKVDFSIDGLKQAMIDNTNAIMRLETKLSFFIERYDKELSGLEKKIPRKRVDS